jgi:hypothetical protein
MTAGRVIFHIDRLVLEGIAPEGKEALARGLGQGLARMFGDREAVQRLGAAGDATHLRVHGVTLAAGTAPQHMGERVARVIAKGMTK